MLYKSDFCLAFNFYHECSISVNLSSYKVFKKNCIKGQVAHESITEMSGIITFHKRINS